MSVVAQIALQSKFSSFIVAGSALKRDVVVDVAHPTNRIGLIASTERCSPKMICKKRMKRLCAACITLLGGVVSSQLINDHEFLPVDEAFPTAAELSDDERVLARWVMPDGYYLYRHALKLVGKEGTELGSLSSPPGKQKTDEFFGEVEVYYNFLEISAPVIGQSQAEIVVDVHYQGCADAGLCYPPEVREFRFVGVGADVDIASTRTLLDTGGVNIWVAIGSALLAGLILNLMPCVFPILSIKALSIVQHAGESDAVRHAIGYLSGVVATFLALAVLLLVFRSFGVAVGWGFQLQSPGFVVAMILLFFVMSMNLLGVIEIPGFGLAMTRPNPFMTGVLAVIVATPCTVPFMAAAIGYAISQGGIDLVMIMGMMGVGMALPYIAVTATPRISTWLPRPGQWMVTFKRIMSIPLVLTVVWLVWVLTRQVGLIGVLWSLSAMVLLAIAAFVGRRQVKWLTSVWAIMLVVIAGTVYAVSWSNESIQTPESAMFKYEEFQELVAKQRPLFLNVTADWCLTCLANERTTLSRDSIRQLFDVRDVRYVKVDWTNRDAEITKLLEQFGRYGVPMYVLYPSDGQPTVLPQVLTPELVRNFLTEHEDPSI